MILRSDRPADEGFARGATLHGVCRMTASTFSAARTLRRQRDDRDPLLQSRQLALYLLPILFSDYVQSWFLASFAVLTGERASRPHSPSVSLGERSR